MGKTGLLTGFFKSLVQNRARLAHSQLVLGQAQQTNWKETKGVFVWRA
jgi:hypothetical protein